MKERGNELVKHDVPSIYALIRVNWAASGSLLKFPLCNFKDYNDNWGRF